MCSSAAPEPPSADIDPRAAAAYRVAAAHTELACCSSVTQEGIEPETPSRAARLLLYAPCPPYACMYVYGCACREADRLQDYCTDVYVRVPEDGTCVGGAVFLLLYAARLFLLLGGWLMPEARESAWVSLS